MEDIEKGRDEALNEVMRALSGGLAYEKQQNRDIPEGTVSTQPYFSDLMIPIGLK